MLKKIIFIFMVHASLMAMDNGEIQEKSIRQKVTEIRQLGWQSISLIGKATRILFYPTDRAVLEQARIDLRQERRDSLQARIDLDREWANIRPDVKASALLALCVTADALITGDLSTALITGLTAAPGIEILFNTPDAMKATCMMLGCSALINTSLTFGSLTGSLFSQRALDCFGVSKANPARAMSQYFCARAGGVAGSVAAVFTQPFWDYLGNLGMPGRPH